MLQLAPESILLDPVSSHCSLRPLLLRTQLIVGVFARNAASTFLFLGMEIADMHDMPACHIFPDPFDRDFEAKICCFHALLLF